MSEEHTVSFSLELNVEPSVRKLRRVQALVFKIAGLLRRTGLLPKEIDETFAKLQQFITLANQARLAWIALQAATGPIGWGFAAVSLTTTAFTLADTLSVSRGY